MKCLSVRQPWADLIIYGPKTIEVRSWQTSYRGQILIHSAGCKVDRADCKRLGLDVGLRGAILGVATLSMIFRLDTRGTWNILRGAHWCRGPLPPYGSETFGWRILSPQPFPEPVSFKGQLGLFNVPDELVREQLRQLK